MHIFGPRTILTTHVHGQDTMPPDLEDRGLEAKGTSICRNFHVTEGLTISRDIHISLRKVYLCLLHAI